MKKALIDLTHPGHVHLYKNVIKILKRENYVVKIIAREKEVTTALLNEFNIEFELVGNHKYSLFGKSVELVQRTSKIYTIAKNFKPDVMSGFCNMYLAYVGKLLDIPTIILSDTEHATLQNILTFPFSTRVLTPSSFRINLGLRQIKYSGFHELAYLDPKYFSPKRNKYLDNTIFFRFVSWDAAHDVNINRLSIKQKYLLVNYFKNKGFDIAISSEKDLPPSLKNYSIKINPSEIHNLLSSVKLVISEGATIASESSVLGTPTIYINELKLGYIDDLEKSFNLLYHITQLNEILVKANEIIANKNLKEDINYRINNLLDKSIDVPDFIVNNLEL